MGPIYKRLRCQKTY